MGQIQDQGARVSARDRRETPRVGVIMGSASDLEVMREAAAELKRFGVPHEMTVVSAHRTPERMMAYASTARRRGLRAIIAGAGGAAHLPGMVAAVTTLPVIGVPILSRISLQGIDSLLSIVQMPPGVPVATVAVNGAANAGLLAVQILAASDPSLARKLDAHKALMRKKVSAMVREVERGNASSGPRSKAL
jgi:5-(carboxyamino)imidazole ribonucleotide mutase